MLILIKKILKCNKLIVLIKRLCVNLLQNALLTRYKFFVKPHLDYGDILYDKPNNENIQNKIEKVQYRACLVITGVIQGTSTEKIYDELGLRSLAKRPWRSQLILFYKIISHLLPHYLYSYLDSYSKENYRLRSASTSAKSRRTKLFKKSFSPYCINEWNNITVKTMNAKSINIFKNSIINEKQEN